MGNLRSEQMMQKYREYQKTDFKPGTCTLCDKAPAVQDFKYWKIAENIFPWDRIAQVQDMLLPKRHVTYSELTAEEKKEFEDIKQTYVEEHYDITAEATNRIKTIPEHFHVHLIIIKNDFEENNKKEP